MINKISTLFPKQKVLLIELSKILGFGILALILGKIKFYIPGLDGPSSDFREVALLIGIFYFRHWTSPILLALIPFLNVSTFEAYFFNTAIHMIALLITYFFFKKLNSSKLRTYKKIILWALFVLFYNGALMVPMIVVSNLILGLILIENWFTSMLQIYNNLRFETYTVTAITTLYYLIFETNKRLEKQKLYLELAKAKAEESEQLKTAFLQNLSHEIRTPMNGILGFSRLIQMSKCSHEQLKNYIDVIVNSGDQLLNIVSDIIDVSQIETNQIKLSTSQKTIAELYNEIENLFVSKDLSYQIRLNATTNDCSDKNITTDFYKVSRIIYHLTDNALKFSKDNPVMLNFNINNNFLEFSVKDKGIGIDSEDNTEIFKSFRQLDNDLTRNFGGNGLGLPIAKGFTTFLNGEIWLTSEIGVGSTFYIKIPLAQN